MAIVDAHHHFHSPGYLARHLEDHRRAAPKFVHVLQRTIDDSLAEMDAAGIDASVLSNPNIWYPHDLAEGRETARELNEYAAGVVRDHPGRFAALTVLPFPDVDGSLAEIEYSFDELGAAGIGIISSYDGAHLGDARYAPLFDELDRRSAVVYVHAGVPDACVGLVPGLPPHALELPFDTARTIASLLYSGAFQRWPNLRFLFSHGGGALPMLAHRLAGFAPTMPDDVTPEAALDAMRRIWVDTASIANTPAMSATLALLGPERVLFGADFPYFSPGGHLDEVRALGLPADVLAGIEGRNAAALFPTLGGS